MYVQHDSYATIEGSQLSSNSAGVSECTKSADALIMSLLRCHHACVWQTGGAVLGKERSHITITSSRLSDNIAWSSVSEQGYEHT